jgi:hypothetical protein
MRSYPAVGVVVLWFLWAGCGGNSTRSGSGTGGRGGSGGTPTGANGSGGGTSSGGANGGDASVDAAPSDLRADSSPNELPGQCDSTDGSGAIECFPACIANARIGCWRPATGTCKGEPNSDGTTTYCYSNGVAEVVGQVNKLHTFSNASAQGCFSFEDVTPPASTTTQVVFRDAAGQIVAMGTHPLARLMWTIACDGQTFTVAEENDASCATAVPGDCTLGLCP